MEDTDDSIYFEELYKNTGNDVALELLKKTPYKVVFFKDLAGLYAKVVIWMKSVQDNDWHQSTANKDVEHSSRNSENPDKWTVI